MGIINAVIILSAIFFFVFFMHAIYGGKKSINIKQRKIVNDYAMQVNIIIDRYNNLNRVFEINMKDKNDQAVLKADSNSLKEIGFTVQNFNEARLKTKTTLDSIIESINTGKTSNIQKELADVESYIEEMQSESDFLEDISITDYRKQKYNHNAENGNVSNSKNDDINFFCSCYTIEDLNKRYKALSKAFHPDTGYGDEDAFKRIQEAYEEKRSRL